MVVPSSSSIPHHGDLSDSGTPLSDLLKKKYLDLPGISAGILLKHDMSHHGGGEVLSSSMRPIRLSSMHAGFGEAEALAEKLGKHNERPMPCLF